MKLYKMLSRFLIYIPFSYTNLHKNAIGNAKTVLDLGCGDGEFMKDIYSTKWKVTGVDIFEKSLSKAKKAGCYSKLIQGDINQVCKDLIRRKRKFDVVFCSEAIEHIDRKKGEDLLGLVDRIAKKRSIFATPKGFMEQPHEFLEDNPYQHHESGWIPNDFMQKGYIVRGLGFLPAWSESGWGRSKNKLIAYSAIVMSFIFSPLVYYFPIIAAGIIAVKYYEK